MEESVGDIDLPRVFRRFLERLRKITTNSFGINGFCFNTNPEEL
jgi:hypothetical protein